MEGAKEEKLIFFSPFCSFFLGLAVTIDPPTLHIGAAAFIRLTLNTLVGP